MDSEVAAAARELALEGYVGPGKLEAESHPGLARLNALGTELWIDTGDIEAARPLWKREFTACTTNNTLANRVIQTGRMDDQIKRIAGEFKSRLPGLGEHKLIWELGFVVNCRIALSLVEALGCRVSVELHPDFAHDVELTCEYGKRYYEVNPELFYIKVPLTAEGLIGARRLSDEGIPVNFTIAFSARQNYLISLLARPAFCNVFLGRNNQVVGENGLGSGEKVGEKATLSAQRFVKKARDEMRDCQTRLIAASMRSGRQVYDLAGVDVYTIPPKAVKEFYESGPAPSDLKSRLEDDPEPGVEKERERVSVLWEVSEQFREYAREMAVVNVENLSADLLRARSEDLGLGFLREFNVGEINKIRSKGKIPDLSEWSGDVALDDLMTVSALYSFATDQAELDDRIRSFL